MKSRQKVQSRRCFDIIELHTNNIKGSEGFAHE